MSSLLSTASKAASIADLCENYYREKGGSKITLDPVQRTVFYILEYGDDPRVFPRDILRNHHFVIMCWPRQFGKTYTIHRFSSVAPVAYSNFRIGCYGPHEKRARIMLKKIKDDLLNSSFRKHVNWRVKSKIHLELFNDSEVDSFNTSELQIRGDTEHISLLDEADYMYDRALVQDTIEPKLTIPANESKWGKMLMISTPNMHNPESVFKEYYFKAVNSRKLYCKSCGRVHDISSFVSNNIHEDSFTIFSIPGNVDNCDCGKNDQFHYLYDSDYIVIPVDPRNNPRIPWSFTKRKLDSRNWSPGARQEYLGEIVQGAAGMFPLPILRSCENYKISNFKHPPPGWFNRDTISCAGLDYGKIHDNTVFSIVEKEDQRYKLVHLYTINSDVEHPSWEDIRKRVYLKIQEWKPDYIVPDCTGMGDESVERMKNDMESWETIMLDNKKNHFGFWIDKKSKIDLVSNLEEKMKAGQFEMPPVSEPEMRETRKEFLNFGYEITKAHNLIYRALKGHDDRVISIMLAMAGFKLEYFPPMLGYIKSYEEQYA